MLEKDYTLGQVTPAIYEQLQEVQFPAKYSAKITGEEEKRAESFNLRNLSFFHKYMENFHCKKSYSCYNRNRNPAG